MRGFFISPISLTFIALRIAIRFEVFMDFMDLTDFTDFAD